MHLPTSTTGTQGPGRELPVMDHSPTLPGEPSIAPSREASGAILHADADAFFAACHRAEDPALRHVPLVVAGDPAQRHGVVLAASYEARPYGIRSAMPLAQARARCSDLVVVAPDRDLYRRYSDRLHAVFRDFSPVVEAFSIDEAWIDLKGGLEPFGGDAARAADRLRDRVRAEIGVTVSVGVSTNRHLAKQASGLRKPDRTNVLGPDEVPDLLWPLPVTELFGCGERTAESLRRIGIRTIGDLAQALPTRLAAALGRSHATLLQARARGQDSEPVHVGGAGEPKSISAERTLPGDVDRLEQAEPVLLALADEVSSHLRVAGYSAKTVVLKYKTAHFALHTAQAMLSQPTALRDDLYDVARRLFAERKTPGPVRLLGLGCTGLTRGGLQLTLGDRARRVRLAQTEDALRARFGADALKPARLLIGRGGGRDPGTDPAKPVVRPTGPETR